MHDQDMYHPFDQDLLPHSRLNIAHSACSEERLHFQSSCQSKKTPMQDSNGQNKQTTKNNHGPTDHQVEQTIPVDGLTNHHRTTINLPSLKGFLTIDSRI